MVPRTSRMRSPRQSWVAVAITVFAVTVPAAALDSSYAPGVLSGPVVIPFDVKDGAAKVVYRTPGTIPIPDGIVVEGGTVVILDNQGKRLATVGAQSPPAR